MAIHPKTVRIKGFKGLNNVLRPERTPSEYLKEADNVDIDKTGGIHKRKGYTKVATGNWHSVWADGSLCFGVKDGNLVKINSDYSTTLIQSGVGQSPIRYFRLDDLVYFSSTYINGVIEGDSVRPWGIERPTPNPALSVGVGAMEPGTYQVALTFVANDGRESGARVSDPITLNNRGSIQLSGIPTSTDSTVSYINVYVTHVNGSTLYFKRQLPIGTTNYTIADDTGLTRPLDTFNMIPAPKGHIIAEGHGRSWIAEDNYLWYSEPFGYELFNLTGNYFRFPEKIREVMIVEDGLWVASDGLYYLSGSDPSQMKQDLKEPIKIVSGSAVRIPGAYIFIDSTPIGYKWLVHSNKGIYVCFNQGITLNMTSQNYEFPESDEGVGIFMQEDGINRYVTLLKEPKKDWENTTVGDQVTATIIRNGVVVPDENNGVC